ncbi:hypothetical protein V8F20_011016 [Naviculisporaceae sp. PSN 640]
MATPESLPLPPSPLPPTSPKKAASTSSQSDESSSRKSAKAKRLLTDEQISYRMEYLPVKALQINVKTINPTEESSEINKAIQIDDWHRLEYLLDLGEVTEDRESTTAKLLATRAMGGLNVLTNLCIDFSAPRCLLGLYHWAQNPENNYWINEKQLFSYAKEAALGGNLICCLTLMEQHITGGEDKTKLLSLANDLYPLAKSSGVAKRLGKILFGNILFFPHLVYLCGQPGIHPLIIANTIQLAHDGKERLDIYHGPSVLDKSPGTKRSPMAQAASVLNITALDLLLQDSRTLEGFDKVIKDYTTTSEYNPLYALLWRDFAFLAPSARENTATDTDTDTDADAEKPKSQNPSSPSDALIIHPDDQGVYFELFRIGYAIYEGIKVIKNAIRMSESYTTARETVLPMISRASDIFATTLRNLVLRKIKRHLPPKAQAELIELYENADEMPDHVPISFKYRFRKSINGSQLQTALKEWDIPIEEPFIRAWAYLVELETIKGIVDLVVTKIEGAKINSSTNMLYEYILDPKSRETIEPPPIIPVADAKKKEDPWEDKGDGSLRGSWTGIVKFGTA